MKSFKYTDDTDRSYGAAGMAIGLMVFDGEETLSSITLDGDPNDMVVLSPDFYFAGNPAVSAKSVWNQMLKNYNISLGMLMSNFLCRHIVNGKHNLPSELRDFLHQLAREEGHEICSLDDDEIDSLFDKNFNYLNRVFAHRGVQSVARDFAETLLKRRTLSRLEVLELLDALKSL